ncbi:hypothetical protein [Mesorhizobium sp.]|uniref:hypothetical protein n=2 Tax=Mesorhizobium sp. TaxID=1871066 RepID=UPI000FE777D7|nr:hypothetical protein [Mesorhizobium sp.]RWG00008.1 MAG: hypothetical protein EOQ54_27780 [Mesorhizobium sp.]TIN41860.1 MAG: hypothetical protein E5Y25_18115 [Mesorhizobium sp.]TIS03453.1 MAG: hypothetical protein E5X13_05915 [Mesorhizobium sp.]
MNFNNRFGLSLNFSESTELSSDSHWTSGRRPTLISDEYALVIGHFCMCWNLLEQTMLQLQWSLTSGDRDTWTAAYAALSNQSRCDLTKILLGKSRFSPEARELTEEFVVQFSIVNENRNILLHSVAAWDQAGINAMQKFSKTRLGEYVRYSYSLDQVQACLIEAERTLVFGTKMMIIELLNQTESVRHEVDRLKAQKEGTYPPPEAPKPVALPGKPPRPNKLKPLPPEALSVYPSRPQTDEA